MYGGKSVRTIGWKKITNGSRPLLVRVKVGLTVLGWRGMADEGGSPFAIDNLPSHNIIASGTRDMRLVPFEIPEVSVKKLVSSNNVLFVQ